MSETGRIKLVHVSQRPYVAGGGMERMDYYFHKYLSRELFDPRFVILKPKRPDDVLYDDSVDYIYLDKKNRFDQLIKIFVGADAVSYSTVDRFQPLVCEAARLSQTPSLIEIMHTIMPGQLYSHIDLTVCVSETVKKEQSGKKKALVIHNGIDTDEFSFERKGENNGKIILLQAGRREKEMFLHLDELAEQILPMAPGIELWMAGRGQEGQKRGGIKYLGLVSDMPLLYQQADIFVLLSRNEALGIAALEAMACGCVPIVSNDAGLAEVVTDGVDGFVVNAARRSEVIPVIRRAVEMVKNGMIGVLRQAARNTVEGRFDIRKSIREYEKAIVEVVDKKGKRQRPGPATAEPAPEIDIYEALDHYHAGRWDDAVHCFTCMTGRSSPITIEAYFKVTENFVRLLEANSLPDLSDALIKKLYESGYREESFINLWRAICLARPSGFSADVAFDPSLEKQKPEPEAVMQSALLLLREGLRGHGASVLRKGMELWPDMKEFSELYESLKEKLKL